MLGLTDADRAAMEIQLESTDLLLRILAAVGVRMRLKFHRAVC